MKKFYEAPSMEIVYWESAEMLIQGSGIEVGGEDEPD